MKHLRRLPIFGLAFALFAACLAGDLQDHRPPWDAIKLVSFNRGDATDLSWKLQTPTVSSGVTFPSGYRVCDYDGTSNAQVSYPSAAELHTFPLSVCFWIRLDAKPASNFNIIGKHVDTSTYSLYKGWAIWWGGGYTRGIGFGRNENVATGRWLQYWSATTDWSTATWTHVAVTAATTSSTPVIYKDGAALSLSTANGGVAVTDCSTSELLKLGGRTMSDTPRTDFDGALDDVRIYSRELSANEIAAIYAEGLGVSRP